MIMKSWCEVIDRDPRGWIDEFKVAVKCIAARSMEQDLRYSTMDLVLFYSEWDGKMCCGRRLNDALRALVVGFRIWVILLPFSKCSSSQAGA